MNPCKCGYHGEVSGRCRCSVDQVERYLNRISGPLLDRFDLHIEVPREPLRPWGHTDHQTESSASVMARAQAARERQLQRSGALNARLRIADATSAWPVAPAAISLLARAAERFTLSARATHRVMRVARTIADLAGVASIEEAHVAEAVSLRCLDRKSRQ